MTVLHRAIDEVPEQVLYRRIMYYSKRVVSVIVVASILTFVLSYVLVLVGNSCPTTTTTTAPSITTIVPTTAPRTTATTATTAPPTTTIATTTAPTAPTTAPRTTATGSPTTTTTTPPNKTDSPATTTIAPTTAPPTTTTTATTAPPTTTIAPTTAPPTTTTTTTAPPTTTTTTAPPTTTTTTTATTDPVNMNSSCDDYFYYNYYQEDGIRNITIGEDIVPVYCDMSSGGWIVFQRRYDGSQDFKQNFSAYTNGFGDLNGEFWLGLEKLHQLTSDGVWIIRIEVESSDNEWAYAEYNYFHISAGPGYVLDYKMGSYSGTAGDCLLYSHGMRFSTPDREQNGLVNTDCVAMVQGAWWYNGCLRSTILNAWSDDSNLAIFWFRFNQGKPHKSSIMMMKRSPDEPVYWL